jgi:hypothetical protein
LRTLIFLSAKRIGGVGIHLGGSLSAVQKEVLRDWEVGGKLERMTRVEDRKFIKMWCQHR